MRVLVLAALLVLAACDNGGVMREIERAEADAARAAEAQTAASAAFLAQVRGEAGVDARASGLLVKFNREAPDAVGPVTPAGSIVLVHYEGKLADGSVFDSSYGGGPAQFPVAGVVPGFAEAILLMRPGDEIVATMPAELGYGAEGSPPVIPPNAALQFRIELLAYRAPDGRIVRAPQG